MDRLVAELGGIETAIVTLQEQVQSLHKYFDLINLTKQVTRGLNCGWLPFSGENE